MTQCPRGAQAPVPRGESRRSRACDLRDVGGNARLELWSTVEEAENADDVVALGLVEACRWDSGEYVAVQPDLDGSRPVVENRVAAAAGGECANTRAANDEQSPDVRCFRTPRRDRGRDLPRCALSGIWNRRRASVRRDDRVVDLKLTVELREDAADLDTVTKHQGR